MKRLYLFAIVPLLAAGCATEPRYTAVPARDVVVVPPPVSDRPVMRVYPATTAVAPGADVAVVPGVTTTEHAIAESIREMFNDDPSWAGLTDNVEARVSGTTVHLRGTVASDSIRDRIEQKIESLSRVTLVDNGLRVVSP